MRYTVKSCSVIETEAAGASLAERIKKADIGPCFVALRGDLGAGKTAFVRGFASVLSPGSRVKSPTYTIVNEYLRSKLPLYHFDLYRTGGGDELESFGFDEYLSRGICIAEWSEYMASLPEGSIIVEIKPLSPETREITVEYPDGLLEDQT